jgi:hypothetical protein
MNLHGTNCLVGFTGSLPLKGVKISATVKSE